MSLRKNLLSNFFIRSMMADFGARRGIGSGTKEFVPYFQYKIGKYEPDFFLYFTKAPSSKQYRNEVFNKMREYDGIDIYAFLNFHYAGFSDKSEFLEFLLTESEIRRKGSLPGSWKAMLETVAEWCNKELGKLENEIRADIQNDLKSEIRELLSEQRGKGIELSPESVSEMISKRLDGLLFDAEDKVRSVLQLLPTGNIKLNENGSEMRFVQLLLTIQSVHTSKGKPLFERFTNSDLVSVLQLHFEMFSGKKFNTVEKRVRECRESMNQPTERLKDIDIALQKYFHL